MSDKGRPARRDVGQRGSQKPGNLGLDWSKEFGFFFFFNYDIKPLMGFETENGGTYFIFAKIILAAPVHLTVMSNYGQITMLNMVYSRHCDSVVSMIATQSGLGRQDGAAQL